MKSQSRGSNSVITIGRVSFAEFEQVHQMISHLEDVQYVLRLRADPAPGAAGRSDSFTKGDLQRAVAGTPLARVVRWFMPVRLTADRTRRFRT